MCTRMSFAGSAPGGRDAMPWAILFLVDGRHEEKNNLRQRRKGINSFRLLLFCAQLHSNS